MKTSQKGFTLIELVVVIVLLGILGVTALGKFQDLSVDAQTAANAGIASELSASSAINYAARQLDQSAGIDLSVDVACSALVDGSALTSLLATTLNASDYAVTGTASCNGQPAGSTQTCTIAESPSIGATPATAQIICTR